MSAWRLAAVLPGSRFRHQRNLAAPRVPGSNSGGSVEQSPVSCSSESYRLLVRLPALDELERRYKRKHQPTTTDAAAPPDLSEHHRKAQLYCQWMKMDFGKTFPLDVLQ